MPRTHPLFPPPIRLRRSEGGHYPEKQVSNGLCPFDTCFSGILPSPGNGGGAGVGVYSGEITPTD